jgi:NTE family protein
MFGSPDVVQSELAATHAPRRDSPVIRQGYGSAIMDVPTPAAAQSVTSQPGTHRIALVMQGGGALGAYQAGAYEALHEAGIEPDWVAGISIGAFNGALIAGNPREHRLARLREFWNRIASRDLWLPDMDSDEARRLHILSSAAMTAAFGQPGFFFPNFPGRWISPPGARTATSFYDTAPLHHTLHDLVEFDLLNQGHIRYAAGAVNVVSGALCFFDTKQMTIAEEHVMASGALPPGLPMVRVGSEYFWDGGLVSNTPLQHVLDNTEARSRTMFQVDLFSAHGILPRDILDVLGREKDIRYASRTRLVTNAFQQQHTERDMLRSALSKAPEDQLSQQERAMKEQLAHTPGVALLRIVYQETTYEGQAKDYDFSAASNRRHWDAGLRNMREVLRRKN